MTHIRLLQQKGTLRELLRATRRDDALADGRVFVNGVRVTDDRAIDVGDEVDVYPARAPGDDDIGVMVLAPDLVAVDKPAALPTIPDHRGTRSLVDRLRAHLIASGPGEPEIVHPASRLDVGVSGVVLVALSHRRARALEEAKRDRRSRRTYVAIGAGTVDDRGRWDAPIGEERGVLRSRSQARAGGKPASSEFVSVARVERPRPASLLLLHPITGRTHQLRIHAAGAGAPLFGDKTHGGPPLARSETGAVMALDRVYLHAHQVAIDGMPDARAASPIPASFSRLWRTLGGDEDAWLELTQAIAAEASRR